MFIFGNVNPVSMKKPTLAGLIIIFGGQHN